MDLKLQKRIAAKILKCSPQRVKFQEGALEEIKEAITRMDIKRLISRGIIYKEQAKGISSVRKKKNKEQKKKGRRKGPGSRKGKKTARMPKKEAWMMRVRAQRKLIKILKQEEYIDAKTYRLLYRKIKGGTFRSKRHVLLYIHDHELALKPIPEEILKKRI